MLPLKIQTQESASNSDLANNVLTNLDLIDEFIDDSYVVHDREAHIVSYGTSFRDSPQQMLEDMREDRTSGRDIFTVKHCLPLFQEIEEKPKFCVILDPRDVMGTSTLGHKRNKLFENVYEETIYLVATKAHPSVTRLLKEQGARVVGWNSACEAMQDPRVKERVSRWVTGGSCSAVRAISLARIFGYRTISLGGFDATVPEPEDYRSKELSKMNSLFGALDLELTDQQKDIFFDAVLPAYEMYTSRKNLKMSGEKKIPNVSIIDDLWDGGTRSHMKIAIGNDIMWCTPELAAIAQDMEKIFSTNIDVVYKNYSGGVCNSMWNLLGGAEKINPSKSHL